MVDERIETMSQDIRMSLEIRRRVETRVRVPTFPPADPAEMPEQRR
jgi:hypothetical protein